MDQGKTKNDGLLPSLNLARFAPHLFCVELQLLYSIHPGFSPAFAPGADWAHLYVGPGFLAAVSGFGWRWHQFRDQPPHPLGRGWCPLEDNTPGQRPFARDSAGRSKAARDRYNGDHNEEFDQGEARRSFCTVLQNFSQRASARPLASLLVMGAPATIDRSGRQDGKDRNDRAW